MVDVLTRIPVAPAVQDPGEALPLALFRSRTDVTPTPVQWAWGRIAQRLTRHACRPEKDGPAFSPVRYREGATRGNEGVEALSGYVADIDDGTPVDELRGRWRTADGRPLAFCLYSTFNNTDKHPRWRVVFPLARPVPASEWPAIWRRLTAALTDGRCDAGTKDPARLSYLPACPPDLQGQAFADSREGALLDPDDYPDPPQEDLADRMAATICRRDARNGASPVGQGQGRPGEDYSGRATVEDVVALLEKAGWRVFRRRGHAVYLTRPGKDGDVSGVVGFPDDPSPVFYCFTSSAASFEAGRAYSAFSVFGLVEHGGDWAGAARELGRQGYGEPPTVPGTAMRTDGRQSGHAAPAVEAFGGLTAHTAPDWPEPDPAMYHGLAGQIVRAIAPHTEADPVALLIQFLACFGSVVDRVAYFPAEADRHYGNLFAVLVGVSSKGRKGTSWGYVRRLFAEADPDWARACIASGLSSGEGLIHAVRDPVEKQVTDKKTKEVTTEVVDPGVEDKRLLVQESEFAAVLKLSTRKENILSAVLRNAWDAGDLRTLTKNSPAKATGAHVSIIGHITRDELRRTLDSTEAANGFANRFLWLCVRRSKELPEGGDIESVDMAPLVSALREAIAFGGRTGRVLRDDQARATWFAVYHDLSAGAPGLMGAVTSRGEAQVMRLALLYALLDRSPVIGRDHLTAALALWEYAEESARFIFGDSLGDPVADDILRALRGAPGGLTRNDIRELFGRHQSSTRLGDALSLLAQAGQAAAVRETTDGRPAERWFVAGRVPAGAEPSAGDSPEDPAP